MNKTRVICLVGASGSGKTSIAKELEKIGYNIIQSYTTRKAREENEWGHTFIEGYLSNDNRHIDSCQGKFYRDEMIAYFNSYKSDNHYFATDDQVLRGETNLYIVDPLGAKQVHDYYEGSDIDVVTIYLQVDEQIRAERLVRRVNLGYSFTPKDNPEVWNRIRPDREIFELVEADYTICGNCNIDQVTKLVTKIIEED